MITAGTGGFPPTVNRRNVRSEIDAVRRQANGLRRIQGPGRWAGNGFREKADRPASREEGRVGAREAGVVPRMAQDRSPRGREKTNDGSRQYYGTVVELAQKRGCDFSQPLDLFGSGARI